jgi:hypothetical protein
VQIRVGLNSGAVVVGAIGSDLQMDYTAVGQTTHLAARMEQLAAPGTVRLTADTLRLAEGYIAVKPLGPMPVKGVPHPVEVYELTGAAELQLGHFIGASRTTARRTQAATLTRLSQAIFGGRISPCNCAAHPRDLLPPGADMRSPDAMRKKCRLRSRATPYPAFAHA